MNARRLSYDCFGSEILLEQAFSFLFCPSVRLAFRKLQNLTASPEYSRSAKNVPKRRQSAVLKFFSRGEWQTALTFEELLQPPVAGTAFAANNAGRDEFAGVTPGAPAFEPVFPTD